jgi:hypothetical protein
VDNTARMTYSYTGVDKFTYLPFANTFPAKVSMQNWLGDSSLSAIFCH